MGGLSMMAEALDLPLPTAEPRSIWLDASDGVKLHALDWGGQGPNVLFLHGGALSAHTWDYVSLALHATHRCVALDLRGHGESGWAEAYPVEDHVRDVHETIAHLGWSRAHIVGMSMGGVIGAHAALSARDFTPQSLALIDVAPGVSFEATRRMRGFIGSDAVAGGVVSLVETARKLGARGADIHLAYRYAHLVRWNSDGTWSWKRDERQPVDYAHILGRLNALAQRGADFRFPTLLVRGARSRILDRAAAERFVDLLPHASLVEVPLAGHTVQEDNPRGMVEALQAFWPG